MSHILCQMTSPQYFDSCPLIGKNEALLDVFPSNLSFFCAEIFQRTTFDTGAQHQDISRKRTVQMPLSSPHQHWLGPSASGVFFPAVIVRSYHVLASLSKSKKEKEGKKKTSMDFVSWFLFYIQCRLEDGYIFPYVHIFLIDLCKWNPFYNEQMRRFKIATENGPLTVDLPNFKLLIFALCFCMFAMLGTLG